MRADLRPTDVGGPDGTPSGGGVRAARLRFELAEVRSRREELGWSQRQLAERAGMTQPGVARFEAGGTTPTIPVLERLASALGLQLTVALDPEECRST